MKMSLFFYFLFFSIHTNANLVEIKPYSKSSWNIEWSQYLFDELSRDEYQSMLSEQLDPDDLSELECKGFNHPETSRDQKKYFFIVFLSALVRSESAFNPNARSRAPKGGHGNYGLLQLSLRTAREQCRLETIPDIFNPEKHLSCGLKLLSWQLKGAPLNEWGKTLLRPDLKNQLFGKRILLWGPLRQNDKAGRKRLTHWFKSHLDQLPFCQRS